jgi:PAS domain S-box-containing protein
MQTVTPEQQPSDATRRADPSERDRMFRLLVDSVRDYAIFLLDPKGHVASWNQGAQRIKGYKEHEILGKHFSVFYPPEAVASGWPYHELEVAKVEGRFEDEGWRVRKDGSKFWANVVITTLRDSAGELRGFAKVTRDLTERRMAAEKLRESEERHRLLVEGIRDYAIFMLDPEGRVVTWNAGAERIKGYTAQEIIGKHFSLFYPKDSIAAGWPEKQLESARAAGQIEDEGWRIRKDGSKFWANIVVTALHSRDGQLYGYAKITRDMTERRAIDEQIRKLNAELQLRVEELAKSNRELAQERAENETFVYSASHDIRAPLVNLQGFSQEIKMASDELRSLLAGDTLPEPIRNRAQTILDQGLDESLKYVQTAVQHLSRIVDALLKLSRAGRVVYQSSAVPLAPIVRRILESLSLSIARTGARVTVDELPPVWGDSVALEQLFGNLISNAINYLDPARAGVIHIGALPRTDNLQTYFVRDNGLGMPAGALPNLFRVFERFHSQVSGEGMGLAIVHRIVERHNGRIWVESTEGQGSTFYVALPRVPATA